MMIKINSNTLVYGFLAAALTYMASVAANLQDFFVMLFIAVAFPAVFMASVQLYDKWSEHKRRANYFRSKEDAWKKNNNKRTDP